jgi:hypothetical protein
VRQQLRMLLAAGYSPMKYFDKDYKRYFYLAEMCSLVNLSLVSARFGSPRPCYLLVGS